MITRFYYKLKELIDEEILTGWQKLFTNWGLVFTDTSYTTELYNDVDDKYLYDYIAYIDVEHPKYIVVTKPSVTEIKENDDYLEQMMKQIKKIREFINDSQFRYSKLIALYAAQETHLLDKVQSISTSQMNETPQTTTSGLDSDGYATTYTKDTSSNDVSTIMGRLNEIRQSWVSLYEEWAEEFAKLFIIY